MIALSLGVHEPLERLAELGERAEALGYEALWRPESLGWDAFAVCALWATRTSRCAIGTGVASVLARTPVALAREASTVQELAGGRFRLGVGAGNAAGGVTDAESSPVARVRDALLAVQALLRGERVDGVALDAPRPAPLYLAALGPRMLALAGAFADGVVLNWTTPAGVAEARRRVAAGAAAAGRDPAFVRITGYVRVAPGSWVDSRDAAAADFARYAALPPYARAFEALGIDPRRPRDDQLRELVLAGGPAEVRAGLERFVVAGLDEVAVRPLPVGGEWWPAVEAAAPAAG